MRRHLRIMALFVALFLISPVAFVPVIGAEGSREEGVSSRQILPMTAYLQNGTEAHYIFDYSTTYIFNTNVGNRSTFMGDVHTVSVSWYLHPILAGDFHVNGDVTLWVYLNTTGVSANGNLKFTMKDLSYKLDSTTETVEWSLDSANQQVVLQTGVNSYSVAIPAVDHTFLAGHSIAVEMEIGGGASAFFGLWYGNETYDSRIEFNSMDHMEIEDAYTLDHQDIPTVSYELDVTNKTVKIRANVTDPFGGYDIKDVRCTLTDPLGTVIIDNQSMTNISGTPISFLNVYETQWDYTGAETGKYNVTIWAVDNNGFNYYWHREQYTFDGYERYAFTSFWVGGMPANYEVTVLDSRGDPLSGATIVASRGGKLTTNVTDAAGVAGLSVFPTQYTIEVYWEDVLVGSEVVDVVDGGSVQIDAAVYYPTIEVVDANGDPLQGTSVFEVHPNGTVFLSPWITDANGQFSMVRAPGGDYRFVVKWRDVEVANEVLAVGDNIVYTINAQVFTLTVTVEDSHNDALPGAQVVVTEDTSRIVFDSKLTDLQGQMTTQLPVGTYDIDVYWAETGVGGEADYTLDANADLVITCDVYYVTVQTVDSQDIPVSDAQVLILSSVTGSLLDSGRTDDQGLVTLRLPMGIHEYNVHWRDLMVAMGSGLNITQDIPVTSPYKIVVQVHYAAIKVVDSRDVPLQSALVTVTSQSGGVFDFQQTSINGTTVVRLPQGTHVILVQWKGIHVATDNNFTVVRDINASDPYIVKASVYYLTVKVTDSRDKAVQNAVINILQQNGETADTGLTNIDGEAVIRLPMAMYDVNVLWKEIEVSSLEDHNFTMDQTLVMDAAIFYVSFKALDSKSLTVEKAQVTVYYRSGAVMDSGMTDQYGEIQMKLPGTAVDVEVAWKGVIVGNLSDYQVVQDEVKVIGLRVYYLTIIVKGTDGENVGGVSITISTLEDATFDAGRTRYNGKAEFRVAEGTYNVTVHYSTTYLMSSVYEKQDEQVVIEGDTTITFELKEYPPPVYTTVAFALALIIILLIAAILVTYILLSKKLKQAAAGGTRVIKQEPLPAEPVEEGDGAASDEEGTDEEGSDVEADEKGPDETDTKLEKGEGPPGPSEGQTEPDPTPPDPPGPDVSEDEKIEDMLKGLEEEIEARPKDG